MAYLDEDDEDLRELAEADDDADTLGEAMERSRAREELESRERMEAPSTPEPAERPDVSAEMGELDLSALDDLGENAAGSATGLPPRTRLDPVTIEAGAEPDFAAYEAANPAPPDDPETMAAFEESDPAEMEPDGDADDLGTIGAAMDHDPTATTASLDEPYPEDAPEANELLMPMSNPANAAVFESVNEGIRDAPAADDLMEMPEEGSVDDLSDEDFTGSEVLPAEIGEPAREMLGVTGPRPGVDTDLINPFDEDRNPGTDDMDMREWQDTPSDEEPTEGAAGLASPFGPEDEFGDLDEPAIAKVPSGTTGPPAPDFTGADWSDGIRRALRGAFGAIGAAGGGRSSTPFRSERAAMEERLAARDTAKGTATRAHETTAARSADRAADRESREGIASDREDRMSADSAARSERDRLRLSLAERTQDTREAEAGSRMADRASRVTEREEGSDPLSDTSRRARSLLPAMIDGLPPELADTIRPDIEALGEDLSADDVEALRGMPATSWRAWLTRRRGLGGGSPGGGTGAAGGTVGTLAEALRARGDDISDEEASALGTTGLRRRLGTVLASTGEGEIIDGVYGDRELIGAPNSVERRELRGRVIRARRASSALETMGSIADRWGAAGALPETAEAEMAPALRVLMSYSTHLGETGIISPGEVAQLQSELPNPSSLREMGLGGFERRLEAWRDEVRGYVEDDLEARGVSSDSMDRAMGWIASGSFGDDAGGGEAPSGGASVRDPETGDVYDGLTPEEVAEARAEGWEVL